MPSVIEPDVLLLDEPLSALDADLREDTALARIEAFGADVIVVALGLDAHIDDPFKGLAITTRGFQRLSEAMAALGLPLVLVQEGGYVSNALADNLAPFRGGVS